MSLRRCALLPHRLLVQHRGKRAERLGFDSAEEESRAGFVVSLKVFLELLWMGMAKGLNNFQAIHIFYLSTRLTFFTCTINPLIKAWNEQALNTTKLSNRRNHQPQHPSSRQSPSHPRAPSTALRGTTRGISSEAERSSSGFP